MCIIAVKPAGVQMPDNKIFENCWYNNPDGAGFMYPKSGQVEIRKGFMKLKSFKKAVEQLKKELDIVTTPIVFHFRIGTSGGNIPENTHPFPVSEHLPLLQKIQCRAPLAVAHNGIINIETSKKDISDTMEYILSQLAPLYQLKKDFYRLEAGKKLVYNAIQSKMAFLDGAGRIETVGQFEEDKGILYSNFSYCSYINYKTWDLWDSYLCKHDTTKKLLCWVDEGYIVNEKGDLKEGYNYLIDKKGSVYEYDYCDDICYRINGSAFTASGLPAQFDEEKAVFMEVMP
jgi:predicted glutamine amidotransferase